MTGPFPNGTLVRAKWSSARHLKGRAGTIIGYVPGTPHLSPRYKVRLMHDNKVLEYIFSDVVPINPLDALVLESEEGWFQRAE